MSVPFGAFWILTIGFIAAAQETTLRFPVGADDFDVVTFDASQVAAKDVEHWMKFADTGYYGSFGVSLSGCDEAAAARTAKNLKQGHRVKDELERETDYPGQLSPVVSYLKRLLTFRLWLGEQYLAFAKTRTAPQSAYQSIDAPACRAIVERIQKESDAQKACQLVGSEWTNCILDSSSHELGDYPKQEWKAFLDANGVQERVTLTTSE
jgi:hypothetical protein